MSPLKLKWPEALIYQGFRPFLSKFQNFSLFYTPLQLFFRGKGSRKNFPAYIFYCNFEILKYSSFIRPFMHPVDCLYLLNDFLFMHFKFISNSF